VKTEKVTKGIYKFHLENVDRCIRYYDDAMSSNIFLEETVRFFTSLEYQIVKDFIIKKARQKKFKK
jgi:hypothetical protein